jgi:CheY-like chemotaxis protein
MTLLGAAVGRAAEALMVEVGNEVPGRKRLVVVEDDAEIRELELFLLGAEGYQTVGVADGANATESIRGTSPDLVILDLMLPHKDGFEILAELGREPATSSTPVIVVSAYVDQVPRSRELLRSYRQVRRVLEKPFEVTDLLDAIGRELGAAS